MPSLADATPTPARMSLVNLVTQDTMEAMFNPTEFEEQLGTTWAKLTVPGLSHQRKHFVNTEDVSYPLELFYTANNDDGAGTDGLEKLLNDRIFLYAACHPWSAPTIKSGGPPRVLFVWPTIISLSCVITKLGFKYTRFNLNGTPAAYVAKVMLEEIRDEHVTMEDILNQGTQRGSKVGGGG